MKKARWVMALALIFAIIIFNGVAFAALQIYVFPENEDGEFIALCETGTPKQIEEAIKNGASVNAKLTGTPKLYLDDGKVIRLVQEVVEGREKPEVIATALMMACARNSDIEAIVTLLENGADISAKDNTGATALMYAATSTNNIDILDLLLKNGADIYVKENFGATILHSAARNPTTDVFRFLLEKGSDLNINQQMTEDTQQTPLIIASQRKNPEMISFLLDNGADPQIRDINGDRAIDYVRKNKDLAGTEAFKRLEEASQIKVIR